jgi:hypothetical protein
MKTNRQLRLYYALQRRHRRPKGRRGVVVVITGFCLIVVFAFVALSVDASRMVLTETKMQNACDAASLAAAQEITSAVHEAGSSGGSADVDANSIAVEEARQMAQAVAAANGVFVDPANDVRFGKRVFDPATGTWPIQWGVEPYNVVQVVARRTNNDVAQPDGQLPLAFGWSVGRSKVPLTTSATAFVEARDLVIVLDYSGSMNYDSNLAQSSLAQSDVEELLDGIWTALVTADPKWPDTGASKFPSTGFGNINSASGAYLSSSDTTAIRDALGLNENNPNGKRKYPYPQSGRYSDGDPKPTPSNSASDALWDRYINYVKNHPNTNYRKKYGYRTLVDWLQQKSTSGFTPRARNNSEDMWRTPHYPMHAVKGGASLFLEFLEDLDFGDEVGLVGYGEWAEQITGLSDGVIDVDVSDNPITPEYDLIDDMQRHHQAGEFNGQTNIGDGILKAREMLLGDGASDGNTRFGSRPTIVLMTDGLANQKPSGWSLPSGFSWAEHTDYDGDGDADFSTSDSYKRYAFYQAVLAAQDGTTIHTMSVGADADDDLMQAIAFVGGGIFIDVPGGDPTVMEADLLEAIGQIASKVPPAKLVYADTPEE